MIKKTLPSKDTNGHIGKHINRMNVTVSIRSIWKKAVNNGQTVGDVIIDGSKAFDSIDHQILKPKTKGTGITGQLCDLIESYLEKR